MYNQPLSPWPESPRWCRRQNVSEHQAEMGDDDIHARTQIVESWLHLALARNCRARERESPAKRRSTGNRQLRCVASPAVREAPAASRAWLPRGLGPRPGRPGLLMTGMIGQNKWVVEVQKAKKKKAIASRGGRREKEGRGMDAERVAGVLPRCSAVDCVLRAPTGSDASACEWCAVVPRSRRTCCVYV